MWCYRDFVSNYLKMFLNETVMNEGNYFIFRCSSFRRKSGVCIYKVRSGKDEWNSKGCKDTEGKNLKRIFVSEIHNSECKLIKTM